MMRILRRDKGVRALGAIVAIAIATPGMAVAQGLYESPMATARVAGIVFPMVVDTFDVIRIQVSPVAGLGVTANYATPLQTSSDFTVYVFSNGDTVEEHFESAIEQISSWLESQEDTLTTFTLDERGPIEVEGTDGTTYAGHRAIGTYDREGNRRRTWLYVFEKDGQLVKYRATTPEAHLEVIAPRVEAFVAETLGGVHAEDAALEPEGLLWEQAHGPMRIGDLHLPLMADGYAVVEVQRNVRDAGILRLSYRSDSRTAPILNVVAHPQRDTALAPVFARAYGPFRIAAEREEMEFEEDPFLICTWRVPGDETVEGISGGLTIETSSGPRYAQVIAADVDPWHLTFTMMHPPGRAAERTYPPIFAEILARAASKGAGGLVEAQPEVSAAPGGVSGGG